MFVRFNQNDESKKKKITFDVAKNLTFKEEDRLLGSFELTKDTVLLAMQNYLYLVRFMQDDCVIEKQINNSNFGASICSATCFHKGFSSRKEFIVSFNMNDVKACPNNRKAYEGKN